MSIRILIEVNNDYWDRNIYRGDVAAASHDERARERLRHAGVRFLGFRHHADVGLADLSDWQPKDHTHD